MISQVFLSILLPSRRVFLSSELKLPQIVKIPKCHVNSFRFTSLDVNDHCSLTRFSFIVPCSPLVWHK